MIVRPGDSEYSRLMRAHDRVIARLPERVILEGDQPRLIDLARRIRENKTSSRYSHDGREWESENLKGKSGEWIAAREFDMVMDEEIRKGPDQGWDIVCPTTGLRGEVKRLQALLAFFPWQLEGGTDTAPGTFKTADFACLVNPVRDKQWTFYVVGCISPEEFQRRAFLIDFRKGPVWCVSSEYLTSADEWKERLNGRRRDALDSGAGGGA